METLNGENSQHWKKAMDFKFQLSLQNNKTFTPLVVVCISPLKDFHSKRKVEHSFDIAPQNFQRLQLQAQFELIPFIQQGKKFH
jgi:hypothetical protein